MWSTFGWIQSKLRNRLLPENARKIVMSHMWLRLEQMREEGKWEADMLAQQDQDLLRGVLAARGVGYVLSQILILMHVTVL